MYHEGPFTPALTLKLYRGYMNNENLSPSLFILVSIHVAGKMEKNSVSVGARVKKDRAERKKQ
jgi:hypothetical protein